jgi:hypothetical protein
MWLLAAALAASASPSASPAASPVLPLEVERAILTAAGEDGGMAEDFELHQLKPWKALPGSRIALLQEGVYVYVAVLQDSRILGAIELGEYDGTSPEEPALDLAAYRIAPGKPAIGARIDVAMTTGTALDAWERDLVLFVLEKGKLVEVLRTGMSESGMASAGQAEDGSRLREPYDASATLSVLTTMTNGHFVLQKKWNERYRPIETLRWGDGGYE